MPRESNINPFTMPPNPLRAECECNTCMTWEACGLCPHYASSQNELVCAHCGAHEVSSYIGIRSPIDSTATERIHVCRNCRDNIFVQCTQCSIFMHRDDVGYWRNMEHPFCTDCFNEYFRTCAECGVSVHVYNICQAPNDAHMCQPCFELTTITCEECGNIIMSMDAIEECDDGTYHYYCNFCRGSQVRIQSCGYRPMWNVYYLNEEKRVRSEIPTYGIELEIECPEDEDRQEIADTLNEWMNDQKINKYYYFKNDGSIENGFELVTHPASLKYMHKHYKLSKLTEMLQALKCTSYKTGHCGLHIHIGNNVLSAADIRKLQLFAYANYKILMRFGKRKSVRQRNWCKQGEYSLRYFKHYTKRRHRDTYHPSDRYLAVNIMTGKNTTEIRMFRGTLDHERLLASLHLVDCMVHFVKENSFMATLNWMHFFNFTGNKNRYKRLNNYIHKTIIKNKKIREDTALCV